MLPIGERFALISLVAAIGSPRATFGVLLGWGAVAALYGLAGKLWRTARVPDARAPTMTAQLRAGVTAMRDDGPLVRALGGTVRPPLRWAAPAIMLAACGVLAIAATTRMPLLAVATCVFVVLVGIFAAGAGRSRWGWLVPGAVRIAEYAVIIRTGNLHPDVPEVATFALLTVLALHYYDIVYRLRATGRPPGWWAGLAGGWDSRLLVLCALAITALLPAAVTTAAAAFGWLFAAEMTSFWVVRRNAG